MAHTTSFKQLIRDINFHYGREHDFFHTDETTVTIINSTIVKQRITVLSFQGHDRDGIKVAINDVIYTVQSHADFKAKCFKHVKERTWWEKLLLLPSLYASHKALSRLDPLWTWDFANDPANIAQHRAYHKSLSPAQRIAFQSKLPDFAKE